MSAIKFRRFSKVGFLKGMGRGLLGQLFGRFQNELASAGVSLPGDGLVDDDYFKQLANVLLWPDGLPGAVNEVLYALDEMSTPEAEECLRKAAQQAGVDLKLAAESTGGEVALQLWLAAPELLVEKHNEQKVLRLSSFEHFPSRETEENRLKFQPPTDEAWALLCRELDEWFAENNRGKGNCRVDVFRISKRWWFVIRHGDRFQRTPVVNKEKTEILHFRPEKDDVVVYDEELDELSIHAETKGEKELYRQRFGLRLRADERYFLVRRTYTVDPLRKDGEDALDVSDMQGIDRIVLRECEVAYPGAFHSSRVYKSDDVFEDAKLRNAVAIPVAGRLVRASFDVYFTGCTKARKVQVRAGNILKLGRHCDAELVEEWLTKRGFRIRENNGVEPVNRLNVPNLVNN